MADVTPILIKDLAAQTTLQDTDYFIVGGADAKKITVAQMKSALGIDGLQEDVNGLNTKITRIGNPYVLFSGTFAATTLNQMAYKTIQNLSNYHLIALKVKVGDATHLLVFFITGLEWESIVSGFSRQDYYGRAIVKCEPDNNRIGLNVQSVVGWDISNIQITAVYGFI